MTAEEIYQAKCHDNSDICQHLPVLRSLASECDIVVELGVRSIVSTWAFLISGCKWLVSVDIHHPSKYHDYDPNGCNLDLVYSEAKRLGVHFDFIEADTLQLDIPSCDLIFFDTLHTYEHLSKELERHGHKASKYLVFHDTVSCPEIMAAIQQYMFTTKSWGIVHHYQNNNGLLILQRI